MNPVILVPENIANPSDRIPWDVPFLVLQRLRQTPAGFRNDLQIPFDKLTDPPVGSEALNVMVCDIGLYISDRLDNMVGVDCQ